MEIKQITSVLSSTKEFNVSYFDEKTEEFTLFDGDEANEKYKKVAEQMGIPEVALRHINNSIEELRDAVLSDLVDIFNKVIEK